MIDALPPSIPPSPPTLQCISAAAQRHRVPPVILLAILKTEGGKSGMRSRNTNGSYDLGGMQVNTVHLDDFHRLTGVEPDRMDHYLTNHGCFNVSAGAYLLRQRIEEAGELWSGVARYHSRTPSLGGPYAQRVYRNLQSIMRGETAIPALQAASR